MKTSLAITIFASAIVAASACTRSSAELFREHFDRGEQYRSARQIHDAIIEYRIATQLNPQSANAHRQLGQSYLDIGDRAHALSEFARAADLLPDDVTVQL